MIIKICSKYGVLLYPTLALASVLLLSGCMNTHFGVADEAWQAMSESERTATIDGYNERQLLREQRRLEEDKRRFEEDKRLRAQAAQEERMRNEHIQAIYSGEAGHFGDLLRVSLQEGRMRLSGKHRAYRPISFKIADGECKELHLSGQKKQRSYSGRLEVCYGDGTLLVDVSGRNGDSGAEPFTYDSHWRKGHTYKNVYTDGRAELKGVNVYIMTIPLRGGGQGAGHRGW